MKKYRYFITYSFTKKGYSSPMQGSCMIDITRKIQSNYDLKVVCNILLREEKLKTALVEILGCTCSKIDTYDNETLVTFLDLTILSFKLISVRSEPCKK